MGKQAELFEEKRWEIPGAVYVPGFISTQEERELISQIESGTWTHEFARRRQHFGAGYGKQDGTEPGPLPSWIETIAQRIVKSGFFSKTPVQALVNEYQPGQGISAHKDYEPFEEVASLSLASGCVMEFEKSTGGLRKDLWLEPRSLLVLTGEARDSWTHGIRARRADIVHGERIPRARRLSLTLRTISP
jgi:hypothetical protein